MTDLLLLDYNGVIVNDEPLHFAALRDVLAVERVPMDREAYDADYLGLDDRACLRQAFHRAGRSLDGPALEELARRKAVWYAEAVRAGLPLVRGVAGFVRAAADAGIRIGVVSGALRREIAAGLECAGIADRVRVVVSTEDAAAGKPDPSGYRLAIARLAEGAEPPLRAVAVEDSLPGLAAARAAGAGCIMLTTWYGADRLGSGDAVWDSFAGHAPEELRRLSRKVDVR
jgi:HAD superfamily hydrolase (TIGR01509 family)